MGVEALQAAGSLRAADPAGKLGPQVLLLLVRARETLGQLRLPADPLAPALDAAGGFEARDRGDEVLAGDVEGRRERVPVDVAGPLLGDCRPAVRATNGHAAEGARTAT